ncbi:MAG: universal stress protein [Erythrobacter sp.]|uniref:universal stress protein n=1 Tax=Erythrobacter sp. TaxID=1042 RepID=UPI0032EBB310
MLVPVDLGQLANSEHAIETAVWLARQAGASLTILTVANPLGIAFSDMPEDKKPDFEAFVAKMSDRHDFDISPLFRSHESVKYAIRQAIEDENIDLVVMATHDPRLTDHLFGSRSSETALHNDCSILILRDN